MGAYYHSRIRDFLAVSDEEVLGHLSRNADLALEQAQRNAWLSQFPILRTALTSIDGYLLLEYPIPRIGKRVDAVLLLRRAIAVVEFKVGESRFTAHALDQAVDYALDLKSFHKGSHDKAVVPILVATEASQRPFAVHSHTDGLYDPVCTNGHGLAEVLRYIDDTVSGPVVDVEVWQRSGYCPTPTIIEAAQALYQGHRIEEMSRSEAGAENLTRTAEAIERIVGESKARGMKAICFITGVPGAGKTLAGLNIANKWHDLEHEQHAVFLSGNGPLVDVLREALARDDVERAKNTGTKITKKAAKSKVVAFVQNVHHFRDAFLEPTAVPVDRVVIFDEAQRAWDREQTERYMRTRRRIANFGKSEPDFLISVMDRVEGWAVIVCLVGGGQEINTGEAGLAEWFRALGENYPSWRVCISDSIVDSEYTDALSRDVLSRIQWMERQPALHLATSMRSFRAEHVSTLVKALLDCDQDKTREVIRQVLPAYPIWLTRDVALAKAWLRSTARGTERYGVVASSEAQRLKPFGINVKAETRPEHWFLNGKLDIRSSFYLEDVATEFQIQGLELDWTCVAWDGDLRFGVGDWEYHHFRGTRWQVVRSSEGQKYLKNAYRVLLTRARQGMVIFVPEGDDSDHTRKRVYYDATYEYLESLGIPTVMPKPYRRLITDNAE